MYHFLHELLSDKKGGTIFTLFGFWHFFYIALTLITVILLLFAFKNKDKAVKKNTAKLFSTLAFGLYIADLFLMPIAYGEIDIEKLPFHACTAMCVVCFLSYRIGFLEKYRSSFVMRIDFQPRLPRLSRRSYVARGASALLPRGTNTDIPQRYDGIRNSGTDIRIG